MININVLTYTLDAFASGHTHTWSLLTHTHMHQHIVLAEKETIRHAGTHPLTYTHTHTHSLCDSLQLQRQALPEGFGLIDILPHCPGLLQGTSLCTAADKAHSITAADLK